MELPVWKGNGQKELAEVITGIQKTGEGEILLDGQNLAGINIRGRYEAGVSYISEDRLSDSLITGMNISENLVLREYGKPPFANHSIINKAAIRKKNAAEKMKQYQVRASGKSGIDTLVKLFVRRKPAEADHSQRAERSCKSDRGKPAYQRS